MGISEILILLTIGLISGIVGGLFGIGGGIIIIPALIFIMGLSQHNAQGTSLAVLLLPIGILGVINYHKAGYVNYQYAALLVIAFVVGSYFGSKIAVNISAEYLKKAFGVLLLIFAVKMIFGK